MRYYYNVMGIPITVLTIVLWIVFKRELFDDIKLLIYLNLIESLMYLESLICSVIVVYIYKCRCLNAFIV